MKDSQRKVLGKVVEAETEEKVTKRTMICPMCGQITKMERVRGQG